MLHAAIWQEAQGAGSRARTHTHTFFVGSMLVTGTEMSVEALRRPSRRVSMARPLTSSLRPSSTEAILWRGMSSLSGTGLAIM